MEYRKLIVCLVAYGALAWASVCVAADPSSELRVALEAAKKEPLPRSVRFLTSYALPVELQGQSGVALSLLMNSVSRSATIVKPTQISATIWRVDLAAYGLDPKLWEALVSNSEPYWHQKTITTDAVTKKKTLAYGPGAWVAGADADALYRVTGSGGALARLDWFIAKVSVPRKKKTDPPGYYEWADIADTLDGFRKQHGADKDAILALRANKGENVNISGVTDKPRRVSRWQGPLGPVWTTHDSLGEDPKNDYIRNPTFTAGVDAHEVIAAKPNGLLNYWIGNGDGARADSVPNTIADDDSDIYGNRILVPMLSCIRCHAADNGYKKFATDQTDLLKFDLTKSLDPASIEDIAAFYDAPKLARQFARDIEDYGDAVEKATGLNAKEAAKALVDIYDYYENFSLNPESAARELGLNEITHVSQTSDGILIALLRGKRIGRKQFEASWPEAMSQAYIMKPR